ncbi:MAG: SDR family oxidoreductase [Ilumatobacter sp.]|uniref:SDR family oxidoreductase n=1 Tax=Ilumatobacter sp. TaxID=1967498 RepID=UPI002608BE2A|nr:SDR family oxidoreductase [Ilumatobacter sp.]MDJ0767954.1 SDR family oxidoreductase [Ilumatobacter sp.]
MGWDIAGKHVIVTGGNSGIGKATAEELARRGARVMITARDRTRGETAAADIRRAAGAEVAMGLVDLSDLGSIRRFAEQYLGDHDRLDVLVNNAGVMSGGRRFTPDGFEWTFGVNHLGPFLLTNLLLESMISSAPARIVNVSSGAHRSAADGLDIDTVASGAGGYSASKAYARSKLANILFTVELERRLDDTGVIAKALHPGVVATSFGKGDEGARWMGLLMTVLKPVLRKPSQGASTSVFLATADDDVVGRALYWSDSSPDEPIAAAVDPDAARRLWSLSERLTRLER